MRFRCLTSTGEGGIHVFECFGQGAREFLTDHLDRPLPGQGQIRLAHLLRGEEVLDEVLVVAKADGRFELSSHGGDATRRAVLELAGQNESAPCAPLSDIEEEWYEAIGACWAENAARSLMLSGPAQLRAQMGSLHSSAQGAGLTPGLRRRLEQWRSRCALGLTIGRGQEVVLLGAPNVGKSTLANCLLGEERFIVTDQPGTTRDLVEAPVSIHGWPFILKDAAGLRGTQDPVESLGVDRARGAAAGRTLRLLLVDGSEGVQDFFAVEPWLGQEGSLLVVTKSDRAESAASGDSDLPPGQPFIRISARMGTGISELRHRLVLMSPFSHPDACQVALPFTERQEQHLAAASRAVDQEHVEIFLASLEYLMGV